MANTQEMCNSFKWEILNGIHALGPGTGVPARTVSTADVVKAALYVATATNNKSTTVYSSTNEVGNSGTYAAGGQTVTMATQPSLDTNTGIFTPSASLSWTGFTSSAAFDCVFFYNSSQSNKAISVHTFSSQNITAGTFTLTMPSNVAASAVIRIA
jgi:hypothetical protein